MKTTEAELIIGAVAAMRHMGVGVTPAHVETAVNAAQGGIGGEDSAATLKRLRARVKELDAIIDDARATTEARIKAKLERGQVVESITALEVALAGKNVTVAQAVAGVNALVEQCQTRERQTLTEGREVVGVYLTQDGEVVKSIRTGPTEQATFAAVTPYFKLSDAKRSEYEGKAAGLRAEIATPDLVKRARLQQELGKLEYLLRLDASPTPDPRTMEELRAQH